MHADSLENVVNRLTSPPMNVSKIYIPLMNCAVHIQRVELPKQKEGISFGRRTRSVWEIEQFEQYNELVTWNPKEDTFSTHFEDSYHLKRIAANNGLTIEDVLKELDARESFIREMIKSGVRNQSDVAKRVLSYYAKKREEKDSIKFAPFVQPQSEKTPAIRY